MDKQAHPFCWMVLPSILGLTLLHLSRGMSNFIVIFLVCVDSLGISCTGFLQPISLNHLVAKYHYMDLLHCKRSFSGRCVKIFPSIINQLSAKWKFTVFAHFLKSCAFSEGFLSIASTRVLSSLAGMAFCRIFLRFHQTKMWPDSFLPYTLSLQTCG